MTRNEQHIIVTVWNDMVLRKKLEDNPYSLTRSELAALQDNDLLNAKLERLNRDVLTCEVLINNSIY
jgi:hypothetical protein